MNRIQQDNLSSRILPHFLLSIGDHNPKCHWLIILFPLLYAGKKTQSQNTIVY